MKGEDKELIRIAADLRISKVQRKDLTSLRIEFLSKLKSNLAKSNNEFNLRLKMEYIGGSIKKGTAMKFNPDIDVVALFEFDSPDGQPPTVAKVLRLLEALSPNGFSCKRGRSALTISKKGINQIGKKNNLSMDLVPALSNPSRHGKSPVGKWYYQINNRNPNQWIKFNPTVQDEIMKKIHRRGEPDDPTALLICLKRWRDLQKNPLADLSSYALEVLVWSEYQKRPKQNQVTLIKRFNNVLESLNEVKTGLSFKNAAKPPKSKSRTKEPPFLQNPANATTDILGMSMNDFEWWLARCKKALKNNATVNNTLK
jgi:hypothetical protein